MAKNKVEAAAQAMIDNLAEKTGKTLEEWLKLLAKPKLDKHGDLVKWLKTEYGVTHGYANLIAHRFREQSMESGGAGADLVAAQYEGPKAGLKAIYDALIDVVSAFGDDVEVAPKKSYVSLRRNKQFALIQPSTKDRVDVGINLKGDAPTERLEASGSFNAMVSHRVRLTSTDDVDAELKGWLQKAYDAA